MLEGVQYIPKVFYVLADGFPHSENAIQLIGRSKFCVVNRFSLQFRSCVIFIQFLSSLKRPLFFSKPLLQVLHSVVCLNEILEALVFVHILSELTMAECIVGSRVHGIQTLRVQFGEGV